MAENEWKSKYSKKMNEKAKEMIWIMIAKWKYTKNGSKGWKRYSANNEWNKKGSNSCLKAKNWSDNEKASDQSKN